MKIKLRFSKDGQGVPSLEVVHNEKVVDNLEFSHLIFPDVKVERCIPGYFDQEQSIFYSPALNSWEVRVIDKTSYVVSYGQHKKSFSWTTLMLPTKRAEITGWISALKSRIYELRDFVNDCKDQSFVVEKTLVI